MSWSITRKKMAVTITVLLAIALLLSMCGCKPLTRAERDHAAKTVGVVGGVFGLPPVVGESLAYAAIAAISAIAGHKNGRRKERKCALPKPKAAP